MMKREGNKNRKKEPNRHLYSILAIIFLMCFGVCLILLWRNHLQKQRIQEKFEKLSEMEVKTAVAEETEEIGAVQQSEEDSLTQYGIELPEKKLDWEALYKENKDIYAWIYIPGTQVDYPILQHATEDDFYLNRNLDGSSGYPGCIYTQLYNSREFTDSHTVLYGHNMGNGTMFGSLHEYEDNAFFEEHPYVYVYTPEKTLVYEIFAACTFGDVHLLYSYDTASVEGFEKYIDDLTDVRDMKSHIRNDVSVTYGDYLLTMSTCIKNHPTERWIVSAVLLNK